MSSALMMTRMRTGAGFVAALDQSGGSTPKALEAYGLSPDAWLSDADMFDLMHRMRTRVMTAPAFASGRVLAAILFKDTMTREAAGQPVPAYLRALGVVPFVKVDQGLAAEADGVQLMKPLDALDPLLARAVALGVFGTKMRSVVKQPSPTGIAAIVEQQFAIGDRISAAGLVPILEPEILIGTPNRAEAERMLAAEILRRLDALGDNRQVFLKLTIPVEPHAYAALAAHHRVARVLALSGGYARDEACDRLQDNQTMIASFSRALLQDLRHAMDEEVFDASLALAMDRIYAASVFKRAAPL